MSTKPEPFIWAYTDESGNTGLNLFDKSQPVYWTGTLTSGVDLQQAGRSAIGKWCASIGVEELHGSELGFGRIEVISRDLRNFLSTYRCRIIFTQVEKRHVAGTKLVDTLIDSGLNSAVSNLHYGMRPFRLMMAVDLLRNMTARDEEEFWQVYKKVDVVGFCKILERLQFRIYENIKDPRGKELLLDAIAYGLKSPKELLTGARSDLDSPNVVALTLLLSALRSLHKETGLKIGKFYHDEQNQFAKAMREMFDVIKNIGSVGSPPTWICDIQRIRAFDCPFEIVASRGTVGVQLIDVILWLTKKASESPLEDTLPGCKELLGEIIKCATISKLTRAQLISDAQDEYMKVMNRPMSPKQEAKAKKLATEFENIRIKRMRLSDE